MGKQSTILVSLKDSDSIRSQEIEMILDDVLQKKCGKGVSFSLIVNGQKKSIYIDKEEARWFLHNCLKKLSNGQADLV